MNFAASLTWKRWAWASAIAILIALSMPFQGFSANRHWSLARLVFDVPWYLLIAYLFLMAIAVAEYGVRDPPGASVWRYIAALSVASIVCIGVAGATSELVPRPPYSIIAGQKLPKRTYASPEAKVKWEKNEAIMGAWVPILHGWLATFIYLSLRKSRRAARALADAEIGRSEAQRSLLAAQLVAAQAQVDPVFVLTALDRIELAYEADPAGADAQLDELIAFLRAAIPRLRS